MRSFYTSIFIIFLLFYSFTSFTQNPQQLDIYDFVVYSIKDIKLAEEVKVMPSSISGFGYVGSKENISFKKSSVINANIFGRGTVDLDKELSITGNILTNVFISHTKSNSCENDIFISETKFINLFLNSLYYP